MNSKFKFVVSLT